MVILRIVCDIYCDFAIVCDCDLWQFCNNFKFFSLFWFFGKFTTFSLVIWGLTIMIVEGFSVVQSLQRSVAEAVATEGSGGRLRVPPLTAKNLQKIRKSRKKRKKIGNVLLLCPTRQIGLATILISGLTSPFLPVVKGGGQS